MFDKWTRKRVHKLGYRRIYEDLRSLHYERTEDHLRVYHTVYLKYDQTDKEFRVKSYNEVTGASIALSKQEHRWFNRLARNKMREYARMKWGY